MLVHNVFFTLEDASDDSINALIADCRKYLSDHPGVTFFAAGRVTPDLTREVNMRDFDVSLHVVFESRKAHDDYQVADDHLKFIKENKGNWRQVRVFDSDV